MMEDFEYVGLWWFPENPGKHFYGTLKFRNETPVLELIGDRDQDISLELMNFFDKSQFEQEIIHGLSVDKKPITLYKCYRFQSSLLKGSLYQVYNVDIILVGHHFETALDIRFKQISVHYSNLNEWVNISGFNLDNFKNLNFKYENPKKIYLVKNEEFEIFINFYPILVEEFSIKQRSYISIKALNENMSFNKSNEIIQLIQDFLTLGTMETVHPLIIEGILESELDYNNQHINIFKNSSKINHTEILSNRDMIFSLEDVQKDISFYLTNWLESAKEIRYIHGLYFSTLRSHPNIQNSFLNYIMAIEGYHRAMENNFDLTNEEHKQRIKDVLITVGDKYPKHREWLSGRLEHTNEPGLKKRLNIILKDYHEIFGGDEKFKEFVNYVYDTRNILVHPEGNEHLTINTKKLANNTELLKLVVSICLFKVLGFEIDEITKLISKMKTKLYYFP